MLRRGVSPLVRSLRQLSRWEAYRSPRPVRVATSHPVTVAVLAGLVVVAAASVHLARFPALHEPVPEPDVVAAPPPAAVGPPAGSDIEAYAATRHELLQGLDAAAIRAVVSFTELVPVEELPLPEPVQVERLQVLLPGESEPREVEADDAADTLETLVAAGRGELEDEIAELERLVAEDLRDEAFAADYRDRLAELRGLRDRVDGDAPVVFAAVVVASAPVLHELTDDPRVRLVDPAGRAERTRATRLFGVPPEVERASNDRDGARTAPP